MLTFEQPLILLLFIPIGALVYLTWKRMSLPYPPFQKTLILCCRLALFALVLLALAGAAWSQSVTRQSTVFVGDISASTGPQRAFIEQWITSAIQHKHPDDQVGIVAVGRNALVEQSVKPDIDFSHFESAPDTNYTDLAAGLRLAAAILPNDTERHIILLTDGQQNLEDAQQEAQLLQQQGIRLDVVPMPSSNGPEARIDGLDAPTDLHANEQFTLHTRVYSSIAQKATLRIYLDAQMVLSESVQLAKGEQDLSFDMPAPSSGFHTYRMTLEAPEDTIMQNNEAAVFVHVQGPPKALVVEGTAGNAQNIIASLQATGIDVDVTSPDAMPSTLDGLAQYGSVVLADVPAAELGNERMETLQTFVRDLGHGLVVSGGENSYGIGGYAQTPLEQTLPVKMDIPQHKETPSIAVVLIVESLEEQTQINISKEAAKGVIGLLTPNDQVGISGGYGTLSIPMQKVTNRAAIDSAIDNLNPTDPASYVPDLQNAEQVLLSTNAKIKHIILLGDGDAYDPSYAAIASQIASKNITISTVATNALAPEEVSTMQIIAEDGKGRFYNANDPSSIPQILLKETEEASRRSLINETFQPEIVSNQPILSGLGNLPSLDGYVATTPKSAAQMVLVSHLDDPVLAVWQYGLGRVAAWTSDALGLWTKDWLQWNNAPRWWANLVTWTLPAPDTGALDVNAQVVNGAGQVTVNLNTAAAPAAGSQQQVQVHIIAPDESQQTLALQPTAPDRWEGSFPTSQVGAYLLQVTWAASGSGVQSSTSKLATETGMVVPYSPEFLTQGTNLNFLKLLAQKGGGTLLNDPAMAFTQRLAAATASIPAVFLLLTLAALLLPIDIAARRLAGLDFLLVAYRRVLALFRRGSGVQLATSVGGLDAGSVELPPMTTLSQLRVQREARRSRTVPDSAGKAKKTATTVPEEKSTPTPPPTITVPRKSPAAPLRVMPSEDASTTSRLIEAKRKRSQPRP